MRAVIALLPFLLLLPACEGEPENIQTKADNMSRMLENKAETYEAEASNGVDAAIAPLENEAEALLNAVAGPAENEANVAENAAR